VYKYTRIRIRKKIYMSKNTNELSNGQKILDLNLDEMRLEMLSLIRKHPAKGLYLRLLEVGLNVREVNFIEAKKGRTGFENTLKILTALRQLPTIDQKLKRLKLTSSQSK
jgi:hypothetical protein